MPNVAVHLIFDVIFANGVTISNVFVCLSCCKRLKFAPEKISDCVFVRTEIISEPFLSRLQNNLFFLSFSSCSVLEISMRDARMCDVRREATQVDHTRREASISSPTHNFHARSRFFMIRFQPKRHTLKYELFCSLFFVRKYSRNEYFCALYNGSGNWITTA